MTARPARDASMGHAAISSCDCVYRKPNPHIVVMKSAKAAVHQVAGSDADNNDKEGREHDYLFALTVRTVERSDRLQCQQSLLSGIS